MNSRIAQKQLESYLWGARPLYCQERNLMPSPITRMSCFLHGIGGLSNRRGDTLPTRSRMSLR